MKIGRPKLINKNTESICIKLAAEGKIDREVAEIINVSISTLHEHKKSSKEFYDSYRQAKADFDDNVVEQALLKRATGMIVTEVQTRTVDGKQVKTIIQKELPPDATSLALWLRNRKPGEWCKEKQNINIEVENQRGMTREEALRALRDDPFRPIDSN